MDYKIKKICYVTHLSSLLSLLLLEPLDLEESLLVQLELLKFYFTCLLCC